MFSKLLELNRIVLAGSESSDELVNKLLEPLPAIYQHGLAICFDKSGLYQGIKLITGNRDVFYKSGPPNGFDPTAVSKYPGSGVKVANRLKKCVEAFAADRVTVKLHTFLKDILHNYDAVLIAEEIDETLTHLDKNYRAYLFIARLDEGDLQPLYSEKCVADFMVSNVLEAYGRGNSDLSARDRCCSICGGENRQVYGNFSLLKCYNLAKAGAITGGFSRNQAPNNFPVCPTCIASVSAGYSFVSDNLIFSVGGEQYMLLPSISDEQIQKQFIDFIKDQRTRTSLGEPLEKITAQEREIFKELSVLGTGDTLSLTMVFFYGKNQEWKISAEISEMLPSRLERIYEIKHALELEEVFILNKKERNVNKAYFTLKTIRQFTGIDGRASRKKFMAYVEAIFSNGGSLPERVVLSDLVKAIVSSYKNQPSVAPFVVRNALMTYLFLAKLGVLAGKEESEMIEIGNNEFGAFIKDKAAFFDKPEKVAAFLTGCYVARLLFVQHKARHSKSAPFLNKLRGLKLGRRQLERLYNDAQNKIRQYEKFGSYRYVAKINPILDNAWVACGSRWNATDDETTFAFNIGMGLSWQITNESMPVEELEAAEL